VAQTLRPLTIGELLDRTFFYYRRHFVLFVGIAALPSVILLAFQLVGVFFRPVEKINNVLETYPKGIAGFRRYTELLDLAPDPSATLGA